MLCFRRPRRKVGTEIRGQSAMREEVRTQSRRFERRNKIRCTFCGGKKCAREDWTRHSNAAIRGLHSDWINENILATQRLSSRIIQEFDIIQQFKEYFVYRAGITSVINLQLPGEHPYCGDGLKERSGFSYMPEELYNSGLFFYNYGWPDMKIPSIDLMVNIVKIFCFTIESGGKVAVHCHAGYGRTGIAIACYLIYALNMGPMEAIKFIRSKRPGCVETKAQKKFVNDFYECKV
jgi:hypothetical protein